MRSDSLPTKKAGAKFAPAFFTEFRLKLFDLRFGQTDRV